MTDENRQIAHLCCRPAWDCVQCARPWPCDTARRDLLTEFHEYRSTLSIYMSGQMNDAYDDLTAEGAAPPRDLDERFLAWIRLPSSD